MVKKYGYESEPQLRARIAARLMALKALKHSAPGYMAKVTGVPRASLFDYENGRRNISAHRAVKIAAFYGVSLDFLLTGEGRGKINVVYFDSMPPPELKPKPPAESIRSTHHLEGAPPDSPATTAALEKAMTPVTKSAKKSTRKDKHGEREYKFDLS